MKRVILVALSILFATTTSFAGVIGDTNGDGEVGIAEALYALQVSSGLHPDLPDSCAITGHSDWATATSYNICDVVKHEGTYYICSQAHTSEAANTPPNITYWTVLGLKGDTGPIAGTDKQFTYNDNGSPAGAEAYYDKATGNVGIGTTSPATTLDINGVMRLAKNSVEPFTCDATHEGAIALTSRFTTCACNGSSWVLTINNGTANCEWTEIVACNNSHLGLCENDVDCTTAGGYWLNDNTCYSLSEIYQGDQCINIEDGTVVRQGLMWQQSDDGVTRDWAEADTYCSDLVLAGYSDWRLPLKDELIGLVVCSNGKPTPLLDGVNCYYNSTAADYPTIDACFSSKNNKYWTSSQIDYDYVWVVDFSNGLTTSSHTGIRNTRTYEYVRCVR